MGEIWKLWDSQFRELRDEEETIREEGEPAF
jgi:hypothetical protein